LGELEPFVECPQQILGAAADLIEPIGAQAIARVRERVERGAAGRGERDRCDTFGEERGLLVERERKAEVDELTQCPRPARRAARLVDHPRGNRLDECTRRRAWRVARDLDAQPSVTADGVEVDHGGDIVAKRRPGREPRRTQSSECAPVGREKQQGVIRAQRLGRDPGRTCICARELDQHRRAGGVVVRTLAASVVVAMRHHYDRPR
jgi:hypothetical protein